MNRYCRAIKGEHADTDAYFRYIAQVPLHNMQQMSAFISVCCQMCELPEPDGEQRICLGKADPLRQRVMTSDKYIDHYGDCLLALMVAVSSGDADKAMKVARIVCTYELAILQELSRRGEMLHRLMSVSAVIHYGARRAGVPLAAVERLATVCTERFLRLEEPFDILPLVEDFLNEVCALVHSCSRHLYSDHISTVVDYIQTHFMDDITPGAIAREFGMNASYLATCFRRETGQTLREYISHVRMKYAGELLLLSNMAIGDICMKVGIADQAYFTKLFRKEFGVSPSGYRQKMIGK